MSLAEKRIVREALERMRLICSREEKCKSDIKEKLQKFDLQVEEMNYIIQTLEDENFLNELRFAKSFAKDKFRFNKWGRLKINYALRQKKVNTTIIQDAFLEIDENEYALMVMSELKKKSKTIRAKNSYELRGKLFQFAASRGFENEYIKQFSNKENQDYAED